MKLIQTNKGKIDKIIAKCFEIPFREEQGIYVRKGKDVIYPVMTESENGLTGEYDNILYNIKYDIFSTNIGIEIEMENLSDETYAPNALGFNLGIDCYMEEYPAWNRQFFPTFLRCEKTHFWGYMMSPVGNKVAVTIDSPVASYHLDYNIMWGFAYGHKIYAACIDFLHEAPLPERHPQGLCAIEPHEKKKYVIKLTPVAKGESFEKCVAENGFPVIGSDKYTLEPGENPNIEIYSNQNYKLKWIYPDTSEHSDLRTEQYGKYTLIAENESGYVSEGTFFCRKCWSDYLKMARTESINKPQKATTHCESWYGFFSAFLAAKHYPNEVEDKISEKLFEEILPILYDIDKAEPIIIPWRIQNTSAMISLLTDKFSVSGNKSDLNFASRLADWLLTNQNENGAFLSEKKNHYTCVIYVAKSVLELAKVELETEEFKQAGKRHFEAAGRAIEDLVLNLEDIGTEGEHTLEDGMISCSALQIGMYALMLPENEREKYIQAAEHMINVHECLEQNTVPDCRYNGCSLRFWESQYDVMILHNFVNSPHGWTAWTIYAKYYLYLLTGKTKYLKEAVNAMGACVQLMSLDGELRWAFAVDPYIKTKIFEPDTTKPIEDGYESLKLYEPAYRGKFKNGVIGEEYIEMISGWFRMGERKVSGGYFNCPVIYADREEKGDIQGGACDNDVHEIFKCLEETFLKKIFITEDNGKVYIVGGIMKDGIIYATDDAEKVHINCPGEFVIEKKDGSRVTAGGKGFIDI